jgi:hypothetical protein
LQLAFEFSSIRFMDFVINRYKSITSLNVQSQEIFIMLNKHKLQRIAIATSAFLAFGTTQLIANAETVTITGLIQGSTCGLSSDVGAGTTESKSFTLPLGTVALTVPSATVAAGTTFGTIQRLEFKLVAPGGGSACTFTNGTAGWDMAIAPSKTGFITTIGTSTFLSNMVGLADGGTNAVVRLTGGVGPSASAPSNEIALTEVGSFVSSQSAPFRAQAASAITLGAQFANPVANQKPTSGSYSSTLTVSVAYR